jgi:hypothetical protein
MNAACTGLLHYACVYDAQNEHGIAAALIHENRLQPVHIFLPPSGGQGEVHRSFPALL